MELFLEMLVHDINHSVTESPEREHEDEQDKRKQNISAVIGDEHLLLWRQSWIERGRAMLRRRRVHNRVLFLKCQSHLRTDDYNVRDAPRAARIDHPLNVRLKISPGLDL